MARAERRLGLCSAEADMRVSGKRTRLIAGGLAAALALASAAPALAEPPAVAPPPVLSAPITTAPAVIRLRPRDAVAPSPVRWRRVRVPPGILAGVPTGASPTPPRLRPFPAPFPVGFMADPYYAPPAVAVVPPPIVVAPPFFYDIEPIAWPFDGGCFVPSDFAGQHGYVGSCAESLYQQWISRPY
jgi:hypothetical protein